MAETISRTVPAAVLRGEFACHPAVAAWRQLAPDAPVPQRIEVLREGTKSNTYRLVESTPDGASIIAQRARMAKALIERTVYEEILPRLPVTSPRYHGWRAENPHFAWLFLEDVGDERYATSDREQYALAGRWLGLMHTSTTRCADAATAAARLPDGGPARYLQHLRAARANILRNICNPALTVEEITLLKTIVSQHDLLEARWGWLEEPCRRAPSTLVHGDFRPKNAYIRRDHGGARLFPFDWETAGWGPPAADLTRVDIAAYWSVAGECWSLDLEAVRRLATVGQIFRSLAAMSWVSPQLAYDSPLYRSRPMSWLRTIQARLSDAVRALGGAA